MRAAMTADAPVADRAQAMVFAGWFEASGGDLDRAVAEIRAAIDLGGDRALGRLFLAFAHSQRGRPHEALAVLAECRDVLRGWEQGAAWLLTAWAEIALGEVARGRHACDEALRLLGPLGDRWALAHAEALLGGLAQAEHRFADAVVHLTRAADAADRLGFAAAGALHRTNLGRALQQSGDLPAADAMLEHAIAAGQAAGDLRVVALARVRLARVRRARGRPGEARELVEAARTWYHGAGGGDGALLAEHLAATLDGDQVALREVLVAARRDGDAEAELLTLDALAGLVPEPEAAALREQADQLLPAVSHLVTDRDR
jgi:tetratricopeptide (TPR) repeat protein